METWCLEIGEIRKIRTGGRDKTCFVTSFSWRDKIAGRSLLVAACEKWPDRKCSGGG
jgi:hypothetical protein